MIQTRISLLRNKFFFLLGIIIFLSIFFIALSNLQTNQNDLILKIEKLELQNEAMNKQVEVEKEQQHQRLSAERQLYEKTKKELNQKLREQKEIHEKENNEAQLRFNSLQQQYKILATKQHDDLEKHCSEVQKKLSIENDEMKRKLDHLNAQSTKLLSSKDNDIAVWKIKFENSEKEKDKLQALLNTDGTNNVQTGNIKNSFDEHHQLIQLKYRNYQLEQENKDLKKKLHINENNEQKQHVSPASDIKAVDKSFQEQIPVSDDHYKIPINIRNKSKSNNINLVKETSNNNIVKKTNKGIINSVENFQIIPEPMIDGKNVLQQPATMSSRKTTSTTPTSVFNDKHNNIINENQAIPENKMTSSGNTTKSSRKLPKFVLPIPDLKNDENEISMKEPVKEDKKQILDETLNKPQNDDINDIENGAHEINDNDFNIEEKNQRSFDNIDQDKNIVNNAAEEFDVHKPVDSKKSLGNEEMDLEIINRPPNSGNIKDKLKDEIANDHGKEEAYPEEDLHLEQQDEDLGDIGEYDDPNALKNQGVAERN